MLDEQRRRWMLVISHSPSPARVRRPLLSESLSYRCQNCRLTTEGLAWRDYG